MDGRILCSMCTKPHPIAKKAYNLFLEANLGDPTIFPAATLLEQEVTAQLKHLTNIINPRQVLSFQEEQKQTS